MKKPINKLGKLPLGIGGLLLALLLLELFVGLFFDQLTTEYGRKNLERAIACAQGACPQQTSIEALNYLRYRNRPNFEKDGIRQHNWLGIRGSFQMEIDKKPDTYRILCLGGSTTYGSGISKPEDCWPGLLEAELNAGLTDGMRFEVLNAGLNNATSFEFLTHYQQLYRDLKPDLVILHCGLNDAAPLLYPDYAQLYQHWAGMRCAAASGLRPHELKWVERSKLVHWWYSRVFAELEVGGDEPFVQWRDQSELNPNVALTNVRSNEARLFAANLEMLNQQLQSDEVKLLLFGNRFAGRALLDSENGTAIAEAERLVRYESLFSAWEAALEKNLLTMKDLADENGIVFLPSPPALFPIDVYIDHCHLNETGQQMKADYLAYFLQYEPGGSALLPPAE